MSRRFDYGTSEGMLQRLHPQRRKRMVIPPLLALMLVLCLTGTVHRLVEPLAGRRPAGGRYVRLCAAGWPAPAPDRTGGSRRRPPAGAGQPGLLSELPSGTLLLPAADRGRPVCTLLWLLFLALLVCAAGVDFGIKKPQQSFVAFTGIYTSGAARLRQPASSGAACAGGLFRIIPGCDPAADGAAT